MCSILKAVCSAGESIVLTFFVLQVIARENSAVILEVAGVFRSFVHLIYICSFFTTYVLDSYCKIRG